MEKASTLDKIELEAVIHRLFIDNLLICYEAYSSINLPIRKFEKAEDLWAMLEEAMHNKYKFVKLALYYPEMGAVPRIDTVEASSKYSGGPEYREVVEGLGLILLHLYFEADNSSVCIIGKRFENITELDPSWNWAWIQDKYTSIKKLFTENKKTNINMNIKELHNEDKAVSALSIFKGTEANNISIQLNTGALLKEHITKVPALLVCIIGKAVYGDEEGKRIELLPGDYVHITAMVKHWVEALEDSQLILMK